MLSISEFSEMCCLSPQTLRFYHSEGLLVPAGVDERTGYRSYLFGQVEQAMLITVLRRAGMSVKTVRRALEEPNERLPLLDQHSEEVQRRRRDQDEAIDEARRFFDAWPQPRLRRVPATTVAAKPVSTPLIGNDQDDWDEVGAAVTATVAELAETAESCGAVVSGTPWRTWVDATPELRSLTSEGLYWSVEVPVAADGQAIAALSDEVEVHDFAARDELSIFIPGRDSMEKYSTALARLAGHPLDAAYIDVSRMRFVLHDGGIETAAAIRRLDGTGGTSEEW
ncbi:hypothetical protein LP52_04860 [Streptomonospora alba]|uniref:HTH merR-type domain-containing protein n=1 Tax=Streptomonospora alba TaxID=183763 RepID=A0A0C2FKH6_9ACTN|nr:MerR family transcriptional regulator [Streptomonospora alba]KIH99839.1 hypothetical protein LP52_04860 [Streptomonospora alba]